MVFVFGVRDMPGGVRRRGGRARAPAVRPRISCPVRRRLAPDARHMPLVPRRHRGLSGAREACTGGADGGRGGSGGRRKQVREVRRDGSAAGCRWWGCHLLALASLLRLLVFSSYFYFFGCFEFSSFVIYYY